MIAPGGSSTRLSDARARALSWLALLALSEPEPPTSLAVRTYATTPHATRSTYSSAQIQPIPKTNAQINPNASLQDQQVDQNQVTASHQRERALPQLRSMNAFENLPVGS
jgi:hypothetical protein